MASGLMPHRSLPGSFGSEIKIDYESLIDSLIIMMTQSENGTSPRSASIFSTSETGQRNDFDIVGSLCLFFVPDPGRAPPCFLCDVFMPTLFQKKNENQS